MKKITTCLGLLIYASIALAQINYTANDTIRPYQGLFGYGTNSGYFPPHNNTVTSNLAAGNPSASVTGAGCRSYRSTIPDNHITTWGLNVDYQHWQHYDNLGMKENVAFVGYPHDSHRDQSIYCPSRNAESGMFLGMYLPIWDGGANGTPVNENNLYAKYLWDVVNLYKGYVRFWEIWNEPDFDGGANGWKPPSVNGNWWGRDDFGCELVRFNGTIFDYIRLLRISWEVIKYIDPNAYIATGGIGYESFLDAILRNTDNPTDGSVTVDYPLKGGAYFDVLCYHVYSQFEPETRYYDLNLNQWVNKRHSDAGADGVTGKKGRFQQVLHNRGYDGVTYPEKIWILTEHNVGRQAFGHSIGGEELQRNYMIKTLVTQQLEGVVQSYVYGLAETKMLADATSTFDLMGLYSSITNQQAYSQPLVQAGLANLSMSQILYGTTVDLPRTQAMNLPSGVRGGAFRHFNGTYTYVLWAETTTDQSEAASATYTFPGSFGGGLLTRREWNYAQTTATSQIVPTNINLTGTPVFLTANPPLPVDLIKFIAKPTDGGIITLNWVTGDEKENKFFTIERSPDGSIFEPLEEVPSTDNPSDKNTYQAWDWHPIPGRSYYRLKQTDVNGLYTYSPVVEVRMKTVTDPQLEIFPNPVDSNQHLQAMVTLHKEQEVYFELLDLSGKKVLENRINAEKGENLIHIDISALNLGTIT